MVQKAIGALLKERRTKLDWSLDQAEKQTSIKKIYISALETDNYSLFPGPFYVRAYLKQYAQRLELDVDAILEAFDSGIPVEVEGPFEDTGNYRFIRPDEREIIFGEEDEKPRNWFQRYMPVLLLSSFAIIILVVVTIIVVLNYPKGSAVSPDSYSVSQGSSSSSSSVDSASSNSSSASGASMTHSADGVKVQVKNGSNPTLLSFKLKDGVTAATVNVSGTVNQTANLTNAAPSATITLEKDVSETTLTLSDFKALDIQIDGQDLDLADVPNPPNTLTLEMTY